jgi:hypothetical protein
MRFDVARKTQTARRLALVILLYSVPLPATLGPVLDPDIWWHLRTGEWIIDHAAVPRVDPFSSFGMGKPWVAYSWLFEVIVYGLHETFGLVGIVLYTTVLSLLIAVALHRLVRRFTVPFGGEILLTAAGLAAMMPLFTPRPWLFTILFFIVELDLILTARRSGSARPLWLLPPLFVVWANIHIQFAYGLFLLGLAVAEPLLAKILPQALRSHSATPIPAAPLLRVLAVCILATLVTPYHLHLYSTLNGLMQQTGQFRDIQEMQPLPFRDLASWTVLLTALTAAFSLGWQRNVQPFPLLAVIAGAFLSFRALRDVWFLAAVGLPIIATCWSNTDRGRCFPLTRRRVALVAAAVVVVLGVLSWRQDISSASLELVAAEHYPTTAVAVVEAHGYQGPLYNDYTWGGYLIWRLRSIPVVMDNRGNVHGDRRIRRSIETWSGLNQWDSDPELLSARLVIAGVQTALASLLRFDSRFEMAYEDRVAAVFIARTRTGREEAATSQPRRGDFPKAGPR